ncbi:MAG: DNA repair protein RecN [Butyrivibrio sp.]|nr:DNA repair protein RecN [Butyrivibrio sp.]
MLYSLHVKNLALIEEQEIEFGNGLNIMTGETGAGKSVIIGSVNLALGAKADKDMIRTGADYALIELTFGIDNERQKKAIEEMDIPIEEDGSLTLTRKIMPGRSVCKAGGEVVTVSQLRTLSNILINIHGQNDHQELLHKEKHLEILDDYSGKEAADIKDELKEKYHEYKALLKKYDETDIDESQRLREQELISYEVNEIEEANLVSGEDEELENKYKKMVNGQKISQAVGICSKLFGNDSDQDNIADMVGKALRELSSVSDYDDKVSQLTDQLSDIDSLISEIRHEFAVYLDDLEFDDEDFRNTEDRLNVINHLKDKFGQSIDAILEYHDKQSKKLEELQDLEAHRNKLKAEIDSTKNEILDLCRKLSNVRKQNAAVLSKLLKEALVSLNFIDVQFEIKVEPDEEKFGSGGFDDVNFMISTNPGESMRPINQVASGGELSRIMLGLKTVIAEKDDIATLIFDEIDTGISGKTAWKVSELLGVLADSHQIICITHLPQIAAMADNHFVIEKELSGNRTVTRISPVKDEESISELARLLGTDDLTEKVLENAREMKKMAADTKKNAKGKKGDLK